MLHIKHQTHCWKCTLGDAGISHGRRLCPCAQTFDCSQHHSSQIHLTAKGKDCRWPQNPIYSVDPVRPFHFTVCQLAFIVICSSCCHRDPPGLDGHSHKQCCTLKGLHKKHHRLYCKMELPNGCRWHGLVTGSHNALASMSRSRFALGNH
jgi:hypothetical protein